MGVVGGVVVFGAMIAQIIGGFLGDRYGTRRIAMVFFLLLAFANASLAFLEPYWSNDTLMTFYLIAQAFIGAIAWICIISLTMRLTWSKVGGTQFTAYMSIFNLSGVLAYSLTGLLSIFDYSSSIYLGAVDNAGVVMLIFIDENETDRVLEGRFKMVKNGWKKIQILIWESAQNGGVPKTLNLHCLRFPIRILFFGILRFINIDYPELVRGSVYG